MVAGLRQQMEIIMAQIGSFTRGEDGVFAGTIKTLSLNVKARLVPADAQARRSVLPGADLRQPLQGRDRLHARLVALNDQPRRLAPSEAPRLFPRDYVERGDPKTRRKPALRQHHSA
jgi:hypothetical protein